MGNCRFIDLFAGAGGFGAALGLLGRHADVSVEIDAKACETLRMNQPNGLVCEGDVASLSGEELRRMCGAEGGGKLIVVGGPPCQPFSKAAYWTDSGTDARFRRARAEGKDAPRPSPVTTAKEDARRDLPDEFLRILKETDADGFVFENVPSITHPRNVQRFREILDGFARLGYMHSFGKLNAADYGVAQCRERMFVVGAKARRPSLPAATHHQSAGLWGFPLRRTAGEALEGLDADAYAEPEEVVTGRWAAELHRIPPGKNYKALTAWYGDENPVFVAEARFWNFPLKLSPDLPSWTIAASPGPWTGPFHWRNRRLRTVEMAALQSFPAGYSFSGSRRDRVRQIGNAVPPLLAARVIEKVLEAI